MTLHVGLIFVLGNANALFVARTTQFGQFITFVALSPLFPFKLYLQLGFVWFPESLAEDCRIFLHVASITICWLSSTDEEALADRVSMTVTGIKSYKMELDSFPGRRWDVIAHNRTLQSIS